MSQPRVKWGQAERYFKRNGCTIRSSGGDKIIIAPSDGDTERTRQTVRIGHNYCARAGDELSNGHLSAIRRAFGVTRDQLQSKK